MQKVTGGRSKVAERVLEENLRENLTSLVLIRAQDTWVRREDCFAAEGSSRDLPVHNAEF